MPATSESQFTEWKSMFLARYAAIGFRDSRLYDGVPELLAGLRQRGIPWGIVTNKIESLTVPILDATGLGESAACVVCGDTLNRSKPDPAPVLYACDKLEVGPADTLFAGDDIRDLQAGRSAGTMVAAVMYGYGSHEINDKQLADGVAINSPLELLDLLT
jgi:phosphoglycolate phosphatase